MIAIVAAAKAGVVATALTRAGETVVTLGKVSRASGDERVVYDGKLDLG